MQRHGARDGRMGEVEGIIAKSNDGVVRRFESIDSIHKHPIVVVDHEIVCGKRIVRHRNIPRVGRSNSTICLRKLPDEVCRNG